MRRTAWFLLIALAAPAASARIVGITFQELPSDEGRRFSTHPQSCWADGVFQSWLPACAPVQGSARAATPPAPQARTADAVETRAERRKRRMGGPIKKHEAPDFSRMLRAIDNMGRQRSPIDGFMP